MRGDFALDLGTTHTRLAAPGEGLRLSEPSVVAVDAQTGRILPGGCAVGRVAKLMQGRTPQSIRVERPLREGVIADFALCETMLAYFLAKAQHRSWGMSPRVLVGVCASATPVERRALSHVIRRAGAGRVLLVPKAKAAAIGAGLPILEPLGSMICDLGGGASEIAVLSLGDIVAQTSLRIGADHLDLALTAWLRRKHGLTIGPATAEQLRLGLGAAWPSEDPSSGEAGGVDAFSGVPRAVMLTEADLREAFHEPLMKIAEAVRRTLDACPPDLTADLLSQGLVLAGGGSLLPGIDRFLAEQTGLPVRCCAGPRGAIVGGGPLCLEPASRWKPVRRLAAAV